MSGILSFKDIVSMYSRKLWHISPCAQGSRLLSDSELSLGDPQRFAHDIIEALDLDGDERISYPEFMAWCLGRRKHEVLLHIYDLSNGAAKTVSPWVVGRQLEGVWH